MNIGRASTQGWAMILMLWGVYAISAQEVASPPPQTGDTVPVTPTASQDTPSLSIMVYPSRIQLKTSGDRLQLVVLASDGRETQDITRQCQWECQESGLVSQVQGVVRGLRDGSSQMVVRWKHLEKTVPLEVSGIADPWKVSFETEVQPALSKQGCNSGACHGSPSGKGSFRLSLRAFDSQLDRMTLVREDFGRRLNTVEPDKSLLLRKPLMKTPHGGGMKLHKQDAAYEVLRTWIAQGATLDPADAPHCVRLEVVPGNHLVRKRPHWGQQLAVMAHYSDGSSRDVTALTVFDSSSNDVATVDASGWIQGKSRGESSILVRYLEHIESVACLFVEDLKDFAWPDAPALNYVDTHIDQKLQVLHYAPAPLCSDEEFLRRVHLDTIGIPPTIEEVIEFANDDRGDKRSLKIAQLLKRPEYAKFWALKWGDLLRMTSKRLSDEGLFKYHRWLEEAMANNMPYDAFAKQLLLATGSTSQNPAANFYRSAVDRDDCVETVSQVFLGARLQCAKCHNHPFERWTQDNYYGLGAFFEQVKRKKTARPNEMFVWLSESGSVTQPRTGRTMKPWLPGQGSIEPATDQDPRQPFADWLTTAENPFFAKMEVNRIWSQFFARGIVDPIDDFRDSNPPSNPELLDALAEDFVKHGFDRKHILETILNSRTYQSSFRSNRWNAEDTRYFSHQMPRLLAAEQLLDAIDHAMGLTRSYPNLPNGTHATQLPSPDLVKLDFLKVFGQPERSSVCACERSSESNLGMAIEFFNGSLIHDALKDPKNRFRQALAANKPPAEIIDMMYLAILCRKPTPEEMALATQYLTKQATMEAAFEDVCWALFNTDEFLFQH